MQSLTFFLEQTFISICSQSLHNLGQVHYISCRLQYKVCTETCILKEVQQSRTRGELQVHFRLKYNLYSSVQHCCLCRWTVWFSIIRLASTEAPCNTKLYLSITVHCGSPTIQSAEQAVRGSPCGLGQLGLPWNEGSCVHLGPGDHRSNLWSAVPCLQSYPAWILLIMPPCCTEMAVSRSICFCICAWKICHTNKLTTGNWNLTYTNWYSEVVNYLPYMWVFIPHLSSSRVTRNN